MAEGQPPAVLLGGGLGALSVARSLGRRGVRVSVLGDAEADDQVAASRYVDEWVPAAAGVESEWGSWLAQHGDGAVVFACSDQGLAFIADQRAKLEVMGLHPLEGDDAAVLAMLDKHSTYEIAVAAGVRVPRTASCSSLDELRTAAEAFEYPCALKPRTGHLYRQHFAGKAVVAHTWRQLEEAFESTSQLGVAMLLTEIVPGRDEYCSYYSYLDSGGAAVGQFTKRKLRQWPTGFGMGTTHVSEWIPEAAEAGLRFAQHAGLRGLVNVEFKRDERDGRLALIECNARVTAANELVRRSGYDLARLAYDSALGHPGIQPRGFREGVQQWHPLSDTRAFLAQRERGETSTSAWILSLAHLPAYIPPFSVTDPAPAAAQVLRLGHAALTGPRGLHARGPRVTAGTALLSAMASALPLRPVVGRMELARTAGVAAALRHSRRGRSFPAADIDRDVYRAIWEGAAEACGATINELGSGFLELRRGRASTVVSRQVVQLDDLVRMRMSLDKTFVQRGLVAGGVDVPAHAVLRSSAWREGHAFLEQYGTCFVKPALGTGGGEGVTGGVRTLDELGRAALRTARFGHEFLLEEQMGGDEYRLLFLDGQLLDCLLRRPPTVVGDGSSTVSELVHRENDRRAAARGRSGLWPVRLDLDMLLNLRRQHLSLKAVPEAGRTMRLKSTANEGSAEDSRPTEPPDLVLKLAQEAVQLLGTRLTSCEVVTRVAGEPERGAAVIDVNGAPGLHYHYENAHGPNRHDVAATILECLLRQAEQSKGNLP